MKTKTITAAAVLLLWSSLAWPQETTKTIVLIDASGSMAGFFNTEIINSLRMQILGALPANSTEVRSFAYENVNDAEGLQSYQLKPAAYGDITLLDRAFEEAIKAFPASHAMLLVTDNIQDPDPNAGDKEANESIKNFYREIQGEKVVRGEFFVQVRDFNGPLYDRTGNETIGDYVGKRALVIYALLLRSDAASRTSFQNMISRLNVSFKEKAIPFALDQREALKISQAVVVDWSKEKAEPGVRYLTLKNDVLTNEGPPLSEGEPIIGKFRVRFGFNLPNVHFTGKPEIASDSVKSKFRLDSTSCASFEAVADTVLCSKPRLLGKDVLTARNAETTGYQYEDTVTVRFERGVRFQISPSAFFCYLWKRDAGKFIGEIPLRLSLKGLRFSLSEEVKKYNTTNQLYFTTPAESLQTRIFGLNAMLEQNLRNTKPFTEQYPVEFRVQYPVWPAFVLLALLTVLVWSGFRWYHGQPNFELIAAANGMLTLNKVNLADFDTDSPNAEKRLKNMFQLFPFFDVEPIRDASAKRVKAEMRRVPFWGVMVNARRAYRLVAIIDGLPREPAKSLRLKGDYDQFKIVAADE